MRQLKREVKIGNVTIGGNHPIAVQTMLNVPVEDIAGNVAQAKRCEAAGCQILRVTCPSAADAKCIEAVKNGTADIGLASRSLKDEEKADGLTETVIALDGIAVIVNAQNKVADLTVEQIAKIFTGEITDWSQVGGDPGTISCIGRESGSGTRDGFESITGTKDSCKLDQELTSTGGVIEAVAGNPNAIGYASLSAVESKDTVKAVTVGGVACTEAAVLDGSYAIQRPFVLVTKDGTALSPAEVTALSPDGLTVRVVLKQGVYHQIKRMFGVYGAGVNGLHRDAIGGLALDENLAPGQWRELSDDEVAEITRG